MKGPWIMNTLELRLVDRYETDNGQALVVELGIDGQSVANFGVDSYGIDLVEYKRSISQDGKYFILTCGCGISLGSC